jgi:hypothetical protein
MNISQRSLISASNNSTSKCKSDQAHPKEGIENFVPSSAAQKTRLNGSIRHLPESAYRWGTLSSKHNSNGIIKALDYRTSSMATSSSDTTRQSTKGNLYLEANSFSDMTSQSAKPNSSPCQPEMEFVVTKEFVDQIQEAFDPYRINPSLKMALPINLDALQSHTAWFHAVLEERLDYHVLRLLNQTWAH